MKLAVLFVSFLWLLSPSQSSADGWFFSKNMHCDRLNEERAISICQSIQRHLVFKWTGHAVIWPGYRASWKTIINVWCEQNINDRDIDVLRSLAEESRYGFSVDSHIHFPVEALLTLLTQEQDGQPVSVNSIYHPHHQNYLLRDGCD